MMTGSRRRKPRASQALSGTEGISLSGSQSGYSQERQMKSTPPMAQVKVHKDSANEWLWAWKMAPATDMNTEAVARTTPAQNVFA
mmetsp:Transcript_61138/g.108748  ORF Transcript_61138/g.108748 Transcript_61138/m.108748 type:complete len:85 (+) Transcript_61138:794-1048(+)